MRRDDVMARAIATPPAPTLASRPARRVGAARAMIRAAFGLVGDAVADIVHEMLMQSMLATDVASMLTGALTSLVAKLFGAARAAVVPARDGASPTEAGRPAGTNRPEPVARRG